MEIEIGLGCFADAQVCIREEAHHPAGEQSFLSRSNPGRSAVIPFDIFRDGIAAEESTHIIIARANDILPYPDRNIPTHILLQSGSAQPNTAAVQQAFYGPRVRLRCPM